MKQIITSLMVYGMVGSSVITTNAINTPQEESPKGIDSPAASPLFDSPLLQEPILNNQEAQKSPASQGPTSRIRRERNDSDYNIPATRRRLNDSEQLATFNENLRQRMDQPGLNSFIEDSDDEESLVAFENHMNQLLAEFDAAGEEISHYINSANNNTATATTDSTHTNDQVQTTENLDNVLNSIAFEMQRISAIINFLSGFNDHDNNTMDAHNYLLGVINQSSQIITHHLQYVLNIMNQQIIRQQLYINELSQKLAVANNRQYLDLSSFFNSSNNKSEIKISDAVRNAKIDDKIIFDVADVMKLFNKIQNHITNDNFELFANIVIELLNHGGKNNYTKEQVQKALAKILGEI